MVRTMSLWNWYFNSFNVNEINLFTDRMNNNRTIYINSIVFIVVFSIWPIVIAARLHFFSSSFSCKIWNLYWFFLGFWLNPLSHTLLYISFTHSLIHWQIIWKTLCLCTSYIFSLLCKRKPMIDRRSVVRWNDKGRRWEMIG